jgi:hypothetical protein
MIKKMRQALEKRGYTAEETALLLKALTELLDKLRKEANAVATSTAFDNKRSASLASEARRFERPRLNAA